MERKIQREQLECYDTSYDVEYEIIKIDDIIKQLEEFKEKGATHIDFRGSIDYDGNLDEIELNPIREYLESEEEATTRFEKNKKAAEEINNRNLEKEKEEYKRLKAKFD